MKENKTGNLYTLEWKSKAANESGKYMLLSMKIIERELYILKEQYPDLEHWIESIN